MKSVLILRGLPGAGKTSIAEYLGALIPHARLFATDSLWEGGYTKFTWTRDQHIRYSRECERLFGEAVDCGETPIIVHNTFVSENTLSRYIQKAESSGYRVYVMTVENRHGNESIHDVLPTEIETMRANYCISL